MNLKIEAFKALVFFALGGFLFVSYWPQQKHTSSIAIPESEELLKLKKQVAEFISQKKSVVKEYNCANGALSKETSLDEVTAEKIAKESEEKLKKIEKLVATNVVNDNLKLNLNSKLQPEIEISPIDHYWLGYSRDFKDNDDIYQISYSTRVF